MTLETLIWTACPNGIASNGNLKISVAIGPQLSGVIISAGPSALTLAAFPDVEKWPAVDITWQVKIGTRTVDATVVSAAPSLSLYQALFLPTTPVTSYEYESPSKSAVYTYPASTLAAFFASLYAKLAATLPEGNGWHTYQDLASDVAFGQLPFTSERLQAAIAELSYPSAGGVTTSPADLTSAVAQAVVFLQGVTPQGLNTSEVTSPPVPTFDFHQAYSLLQSHPALLRLFGFVVDLEVAPQSGLTKTVSVSAIPSWTPQPSTSVTVSNVTPVTMTTSATWLPEPGAGSVIAGGLLTLSDTSLFDVLQMDVDGATLKALNFVQSIYNANTVMRAADTPTTYGVPALRSAGMSIAQTGHASAMYQNWLNNDGFNADIGSSTPISLQAEDIAQGYRIDVFDAKKNAWFQLCARSAAPNPPGVGGYGIGSPQTVVPVPAGDEGWVQPATTQATSPPSTPAPVYLPETLHRWAGWSAVAGRPGMFIGDDAAGELTSDTGNPPPASSDFQLQIDYAATPGTLPTLRFGNSYRLRARVVDLAGNSVPFSKHSSFTDATPELQYGRLEPVASPVIVPCAPRTPGESLERLVIRSNYDIPDTSAKITPCERHFAPPASAIEILEAHGVLDGSAGVPRTALYAVLAARDGLTYQTAAVMSEYGGKVDDNPLNGSNQWIYYPPVAHPTASHPALGVPYLPDLIGDGISALGLPGAGADRVIARFDQVGAWPERRAMRLVVHAGSKAPTLPKATEADGAITVYAPKASVSTVRLSSWFEPTYLTQLKLWQWLVAAKKDTPALKKLILNGGHYMFTPYRELTIVHAVRQPLTPPQVHLLAPFRKAGTTYTLLNGDVRADPASTQRVDVLSYYVDPYDDGTVSTGITLLTSKARVAEIPLKADQSGVIAIKNLRDDFSDTKHHEVYYNLLATSRFLEYFAQTADVTLTGSASAVVSKIGFVPGTVVVSSTGSGTPATYTEGVDYTEDDAAGSIAAIVGGSIVATATATATVQVRFNAPPVTRSSLEKDAKPPTADGYRVSIPSSARPPAPIVRYLIPAFGWQKTATSSSRIGNLLRVYLGRPWFESGGGELLGVVVAPAGSSLPATLTPFVSGYGRDPVADSNPVSTATVTDFTLAVASGKSLVLQEAAALGLKKTPTVDVAGHRVSWDKSRQLWFADIEVNPGNAYFPFVKLALVRYQPGSLSGLELSRVVQADFIQVATDRTVSLAFPSSRIVDVAVTGPAFFGGQDTMRAYVQEIGFKTSDPSLEWVTVPSEATGTALKVTHTTLSDWTWTGRVTLPTARGTKRYRVLVVEFEEHAVVETGSLPDLSGRISYLDAIEIT
jgi:hypothetical protein